MELKLSRFPQNQQLLTLLRFWLVFKTELELLRLLSSPLDRHDDSGGFDLVPAEADDW